MFELLAELMVECVVKDFSFVVQNKFWVIFWNSNTITNPVEIRDSDPISDGNMNM